MSFPGRPPMGMPGAMPGMAPRMMAPGYAFTAPMGMPRMNTMMPMQMGMMTPMMQPMMQPQMMPQQTIKPAATFVSQESSAKVFKGERPPVTTVFVGNISERAPDMMIKQMLQRCGNVLSWKRVQGASGKLQAFGFCEYEEPEATLRCIRLLNDWSIGEKKLVVKVDAKTKTLLDDYRKKKKEEEKKESKTESESDEKKENGEEAEDGEKKDKAEDAKEDKDGNKLDENTMREDRVAQAGLEAIMREYVFELNKEPFKPPKSSADGDDEKEKPVKKDRDPFTHVKDTGFEDLEMEAEKRDIINREINKFRDRHKGKDEEKDKERDLKEKERSMLRERERRQEEKRQREKMEKMREQRERDALKERERASARVSRSKSRSASPVISRSRRRSRSRERERERTSRDRSRDRRKEREQEEEEEHLERRKLEKKLREKEAAYQERLKNWEGRERKKTREYKKETEREEERKVEEAREARRLKEFLEDYDDLRDDPKFYKGSALQRRLKEREKEKELDNRDRQREKEEFEEIKRKLFDEGHPDAETEVARMEREREEHLQPCLRLQEIEQPPPSLPEPTTVVEESNSGDEAPGKLEIQQVSPKQSDSRTALHQNHHPQQTTEQVSSRSLSTSPISTDSRVSAPAAPSISPDSNSQLGALTISDGKRKKLTVGDVFNQDDDDSNEPKKRKLIPLDYDEDKDIGDKKGASAEEKRLKIKKLIENIPTAKDELYAYKVDWEIVDQSLMDKRIMPWVTKKIIEYIGEEEATLTEFICQKVIARSTPQSIQNDVAMILDDEAEVFVVKMWRLLVYETEAKKLGLVK